MNWEANQPRRKHFHKFLVQCAQADYVAKDTGSVGLRLTDTEPIIRYIPALASIGFRIAVYFGRHTMAVDQKGNKHPIEKGLLYVRSPFF